MAGDKFNSDHGCFGSPFYEDASGDKYQLSEPSDFWTVLSGLRYHQASGIAYQRRYLHRVQV